MPQNEVAAGQASRTVDRALNIARRASQREIDGVQADIHKLDAKLTELEHERAEFDQLAARLKMG